MFTDWLLVGNRVFAGRAMSTSSVRRTRNINSDKVLDRWWILDCVLGGESHCTVQKRFVHIAVCSGVSASVNSDWLSSHIVRCYAQNPESHTKLLVILHGMGVRSVLLQSGGEPQQHRINSPQCRSNFQNSRIEYHVHYADRW